jgi:hypothetical protein
MHFQVGIVVPVDIRLDHFIVLIFALNYSWTEPDEGLQIEMVSLDSLTH